MKVIANDGLREKSSTPSKIPKKNKKQTQGTGIEILTAKRMLERLSIALAQVKAGNTCGNLQHEICQIIYSLYHTKEITKIKKYITI